MITRALIADFDRTLASLGYGRPGDPLTLTELTHGFAPPPGFRARIAMLSIDPPGIRIEYRAPDGSHAATLARHFEGDGVLRFSQLEIAEPWRGVDTLSATIDGQTLLRCRKWGLRRIVLEARDLGRYAWAAAGFSFDDPSQLVRAGDAFIDERALGAPDDHKRILRELAHEPWRLAQWSDRRAYPWTFTDASGTPATGQAHLGKALLLDHHLSPWAGHLDIDDDSDGYVTALRTFDVATRS